MSQKSSVPQAAKSVSHVLMSDTDVGWSWCVHAPGANRGNQLTMGDQQLLI